MASAYSPLLCVGPTAMATTRPAVGTPRNETGESPETGHTAGPDQRAADAATPSDDKEEA